MNSVEPVVSEKDDEVAEIMRRLRGALESLGAKYRVFLNSYNEVAEQLEKLGIDDPAVDPRQRIDYTDFELGVMALNRSHLLREMGDFHENVTRLLFTMRMTSECRRYSRSKAQDDTLSDLIPF